MDSLEHFVGLSGATYILEAEVHRNGHGDRVYFGLRDGVEKVAIKALKNSKENDRTERWFEEARLIEREWKISEELRRLRHDRLVLIDDRATVGEFECHVTPRADKVLSELTGLVTDDDALEITRQLALALEQLGAASIAHRDVKPSNAFFYADSWKLADFGISGFERRQTFTAAGTGTLDYMAPEIFRGASESFLTDAYSLGCLLFELLTGRRPFSHLSNIRLAHEQEVLDLGNFRPDLARLIGRLIAKQPGRRPQTPQEIIGLCQSKNRIPAVAQFVKLEASYASQQAKEDAKEASRERKTSLAAQGVARLETILEDIHDALIEAGVRAIFTRDRHSTAWVVELEGHRLSVAITGGVERDPNVLLFAQLDVVEKGSSPPAFPVACATFLDIDPVPKWELVTFKANPQSSAGMAVGDVEHFRGLKPTDFWSAWEARKKGNPPAMIRTTGLDSETLLELFGREATGKSPSNSLDARTGFGIASLNLSAGGSGELKQRTDSVQYEEAVLQEISALWPGEDLHRQGSRGAFDAVIRSNFGRGSIEVKYLRRGKFQMIDLRKIVNRASAVPDSRRGGILVVTNAELSKEVLGANALGEVDGKAIEVVRWSDVKDSNLLQRALARSVR